jgi:hypothetical protein
MTILAQRYGSYPWIRPLGAGMTGLLMLSMLNNKTHWASDYPLAIAIGYNVGMSVTQPPEAYIKTTESKKFMWQSFEPHITPRFIGFHSTWKF